MTRKIDKNNTVLINQKSVESFMWFFCFSRLVDAPGLYDLLNSVMVVTQFKFSQSTCHYLYSRQLVLLAYHLVKVSTDLNKSPVIFGHEINEVFIWVSRRISSRTSVVEHASFFSPFSEIE